MTEQLTTHAAGTRSLRRALMSFGRTLLLVAPGVIMLVAWQFASGRLVREAYISKPTNIARRLYDLFATGEIWPSLKVTGEELVLSYAIGVVAGLLLGYALGRSPRLARVIEPYVMAFYGIPKIALAPLFIIWFGIGIWSKVVLAGTMVFFLVFYNVYAGVRSVDREVVNLALVLGANERQLGRHIYLPAAAPYLLMGMRMAIPYAVIGVIVGEFTSSVAGLGPRTSRKRPVRRIGDVDQPPYHDSFRACCTGAAIARLGPGYTRQDQAWSTDKLSQLP